MSNTNISSMVANFKGGSRPNKFKVQIIWPALVGTPNVQDEFVIEACQLPSSVVGTVQVPYKGRFLSYPADRIIEPLSMNVINDTTFSHRNHFVKWLNLMNAHEGNIQATANSIELMTTVLITQLDRDDSVLKTVTLVNAFPVDVTQIDLDYQANDSLEIFTVQWNYHYFVDSDAPTT